MDPFCNKTKLIRMDKLHLYFYKNKYMIVGTYSIKFLNRYLPFPQWFVFFAYFKHKGAVRYFVLLAGLIYIHCALFDSCNRLLHVFDCPLELRLRP